MAFTALPIPLFLQDMPSRPTNGMLPARLGQNGDQGLLGEAVPQDGELLLVKDRMEQGGM